MSLNIPPDWCDTPDSPLDLPETAEMDDLLVMPRERIAAVTAIGRIAGPLAVWLYAWAEGWYEHDEPDFSALPEVHRELAQAVHAYIDTHDILELSRTPEHVADAAPRHEAADRALRALAERAREQAGPDADRVRALAAPIIRDDLVPPEWIEHAASERLGSRAYAWLIRLREVQVVFSALRAELADDPLTELYAVVELHGHACHVAAVRGQDNPPAQVLDALTGGYDVADRFARRYPHLVGEEWPLPAEVAAPWGADVPPVADGGSLH